MACDTDVRDETKTVVQMCGMEVRRQQHGGTTSVTESTDISRADCLDDTTREHSRLRPIVDSLLPE